MEIIKKHTMPDGTDIQLERWENDYYIGAYPIAKNSGKWVKAGEIFRLTLCGFEDMDITAVYMALFVGSLRLTDLRNFYWNPIRDAYYMGLRDTEE